ncbi:DUF7144 family membrane protein [Nocardia coffeae]|uniref:DUF7144 family membrane protein n=1 Tax=Nocardia coffeae TaxID=2873381 RepID=UPI0027DFCB00|nr:hypothetical protein [Nocardia coffeae]
MSDQGTPTAQVPPAEPNAGTEPAAPRGRHETTSPNLQQGAAAVGTMAAVVLMLVAGALQILEGISAIEYDDIIVVGPRYTYQWNATGWGVVHIVIGALLVLAALALFTGRLWARTLAIVLAAASIVANFLWLPHNPWWSILLIALDAFLIWAIATWHHPGQGAATHSAS